MRSSKPSLTELRAVCQPDTVMGRVSGEHWAGRLYMRHVSLYLTRALLPTPITPDGVTWLMIVSGIAAAAALGVPTVWGAVLAALLIQLQLLFDCSDGEIARWRQATGPVGVYLDRIGHYLTDSALIATLGVRVDGGYDSIGVWTTWGLVGAVFVLVNKAETDLVVVARSVAGMPPPDDQADIIRPRRTGLAAVRGLASYLPLHRAIGAPELTLLALAAAVGDAATGSLAATRVLSMVLVPLAAAVAGAHLLSILSSSRFK
ncbi:MAG: CDP-alcohol phosphatidyltransferase family protein [Nitriliruptorales bacterium]|nr:CDP-alcohol phosphatidyltransferase family protein [Nitriliruptorales bacterium]